jgi:hypothetical protein
MKHALHFFPRMPVNVYSRLDTYYFLYEVIVQLYHHILLSCQSVFDSLLHSDVFRYQQQVVIFLNLEHHLDFLMHSNIEFGHYIDGLERYEIDNLFEKLRIIKKKNEIFVFYLGIS